MLLFVEFGCFLLDFDGVFLFVWLFGEKKKIIVEFWGEIFVKKIIYDLLIIDFNILIIFLIILFWLNLISNL